MPGACPGTSQPAEFRTEALPEKLRAPLGLRLANSRQIGDFLDAAVGLGTSLPRSPPISTGQSKGSRSCFATAIYWLRNHAIKPPLFSAVALGLLLLCGGCAGVTRDAASADDADIEHDPAEPVNRAIFKANVAADHAVMKPVAQAYADHVPEGVQRESTTSCKTSRNPPSRSTTRCKGNVRHAWQSVQRLAVNSTVGVAGIFDVAEKLGVPPHKADFGQTLAVWGVGEGPFVELPLLGPSNARDAVGTVVDMAMNPLTFVGGAPATYAGVATGSANVVDTRAQHLSRSRRIGAQLARLYATLRSVYRQHRDAEIVAAKQRGQPRRTGGHLGPDTRP